MTENIYERLARHIAAKARQGDVRASYSGTNFTSTASPGTAELVTLRDETGTSYAPFIFGVDSPDDEYLLT